MTHSIKALEIFFSQYLPTMKGVIEDNWESNREEAIAFLSRGIHCGVAEGWMRPYFLDMLEHAKTAPHKYTSPWDVL
jgi:hypothetical protein